jgi:hypothetical protein
VQLEELREDAERIDGVPLFALPGLLGSQPAVQSLDAVLRVGKGLRAPTRLLPCLLHDQLGIRVHLVPSWLEPVLDHDRGLRTLGLPGASNLDDELATGWLDLGLGRVAAGDLVAALDVRGLGEVLELQEPGPILQPDDRRGSHPVHLLEIPEHPLNPLFSGSEVVALGHLPFSGALSVGRQSVRSAPVLALSADHGRHSAMHRDGRRRHPGPRGVA